MDRELSMPQEQVCHLSFLNHELKLSLLGYVLPLPRHVLPPWMCRGSPNKIPVLSLFSIALKMTHVISLPEAGDKSLHSCFLTLRSPRREPLQLVTNPCQQGRVWLLG
jgi:hypothetical protein